MTKKQDMFDIKTDLLEYAKLEGTEYGECMILLCELVGYDHILSDELYSLLEKEMLINLSKFIKHSKIVTKKINIERDSTHLEWKAVCSDCGRKLTKNEREVERDLCFNCYMHHQE